ncbi:MAG: hypothetical protein Q7S33_01630 [Nanoarchaeota archaeon]|nr:hypothetical protein [Nanoarchaeota archaeon]
MGNIYRANRQFERFLSLQSIPNKEHSPSPNNIYDGQLIAIIKYYPEIEKIEVERIKNQDYDI